MTIALTGMTACGTTPPPGPGGPATPSTPTSPSGTSARPQPLVVVGLGDSVTAGSGCACAPFIERYAGLLAARDHLAASATNLGVPGLTTSSLADQLRTPAAGAAVSRADRVVVTIGANDLTDLVPVWSRTGCPESCFQPSVDEMAQGLAGDLARVRALSRGRAEVLVTSYWNVFEDGDVADAKRGPGFGTWSDAVSRAADAAICRVAGSAGDLCVDLYEPFLGSDGRRNPTSLLADDGDHPNDAGHEEIAQDLLAADPR